MELAEKGNPYGKSMPKLIRIGFKHRFVSKNGLSANSGGELSLRKMLTNLSGGKGSLYVNAKGVRENKNGVKINGKLQNIYYAPTNR